MGEPVSGAPFPILPNGINHLLRLSRSLGRPADLHPRRRGRRRRRGLRIAPKTKTMTMTKTQEMYTGQAYDQNPKLFPTSLKRVRNGINLKNDRPGDDGTLLVFLLGVIDLASASA